MRIKPFSLKTMVNHLLKTTNMEIKKSTTLPFGKKIRVGNFYILKHSHTLTGKELRALRNAQKIPEEVQKSLTRGSLPYLKVSTIADSWSVEFAVGMTVFHAIDEIECLHDDKGNYFLDSTTTNSLYNIFNSWYCSTATVGDEEYQADMIKAMKRYLDRASKKNSAPLSAEENEKVLDEVEKSEKRKAALLNIFDNIKKGEK